MHRSVSDLLYVLVGILKVDQSSMRISGDMEASIPSIRRLMAVISCSIRSIVVDCSLSGVVTGWVGGGDEWVSVAMGVGRFWWSASENNSSCAGLPAGLWFGLLPGITLLVCEGYPIGPDIFFGIQ
ncbi:hypothetical protein NDU88_005113 [Pleurodeles waltl]|uniref:Uncharacterized protein n=1 Tax=Pleurodeles waltl TaxID=8319 RepID=A0AAV7TB15_PLEWA|nr:hypothetical protein NDU88_005113 [Pleurodeles waltl]